MSQKWIRSKQWDDRHIPRALWPLKFLLRAFSSIPLAVTLLVCVVLYGTLASVPIGLIALAPTYLIYGLTFVGAIALVALLPARLTTLALARAGAPPAARFIAGFLAVIALAVAGAWLWARFAWPHLRYDPVAHSGFRLFGPFVDATRSITVRRLPALEMSELEFYAWWPLKVILLAFIINMVVATVRRIEFSFHNLGVLTVHTGIVTIALGSIYYSALKEEGDMLLLAGNPDGFGNPTPGPVETGFFDNTRVALWVSSGAASDDWQQRPLRGLPRYSDYNLGAVAAGPAAPAPSRPPLDIAIDTPADPGEKPPPDAGLRIRVLGYGSYAELEKRWVKSEPGGIGGGGEPLRRVELLRHESPASSTPPSIPFRPLTPSARTVELGSVLGVEYTRAMEPGRWRDLTEKLPPGTQHALVVEVPAADPAAKPFRAAYPVTPGAQVQVGNTGYSLLVKDIAAQPPFPIITPGYENARSSIAVVRVTPPGTAPGAKPFDRWLYHRFPEIAQDMLDELNERGMPRRRPADPAIRIAYLDCSISQVYFDEAPAPADAADPPVRVLLRPAGSEPRIIDDLRTGGTLQIAPNASLRLGERWPSAAQVEVPVPIPESEREKDSIGNHHRAAIAVEITPSAEAAGGVRAPGEWRRVLWLPFTQYLNISPDLVRTVDLPGSRKLTLAFGRVRRSLPDFGLQLVDFQMYPYPGSDTPRDYRSDLAVLRASRDELLHELRNTSLNDPLLVRVPYRPRADVPAVAGFIGWLVSVVAPTQYKFSQAGWDAEGWRTTQAAADRAEVPRARARFTILGVGNNPGIYIIASGAIMMSAGIPWAFYIKPLLVRARKKRLQAQLAANTQAAASRPGRPVGAQA